MHFAGSDSEPDAGDFFVRRVNADAVDLQKCEHHIHTDPLIAVHKSVIGDQRISEPRAFFFLGRIEFNPVERLVNAFQSRILQTEVPNTAVAAGFFGDQLMQEQHFIF